MSEVNVPRKISENLYMLKDTCNVYILRDGKDGLLVDSGSGAVLQHIDGLGIESINWILHTHHHRDQCQGDCLLPEDAKIAVPFHERPLFEDAENFWRNKAIYDSYNDQSTYFTLTSSVRVDRTLDDYDTFTWKDHEFFVLPTIGHTHGSLALISDIDGRKVAFTGDLIHSRGKVWSLTELQHSYGGPEGINLNSFSLRDLGRENVDMILPSHGEPIEDPKPAIEETIANLRNYFSHLTSGMPLTIDQTFKRLLPHLLISAHTCCTFYALLSESGKAMLIDYGGASPDHFYAHVRQFESWELQRFVEHSLHDLKENHGVESVDVVIPSHYHDDHTCGIPHLQKRHGVKLWALDSMVNILENPHEYNIPCLLPYPMKVDRAIGDGETVEWEEYSLKVVHFPGQTEYHMAMLVEVDGKRVVFTGDSVGEVDGKLVQPIIHRNIVTPENHYKCARNLAELEPDFLAHGHGGWFQVDREKVGTLVDRAKRTETLFESLLPEPIALGVNPSWVRLVPYQSVIGAGKTTDIELEVRNYFDHEIEVEASLVIHESWECTPETQRMKIAEGQTERLPFTIRVGSTPDRYGIAVDVTIDSRKIGQVTEAIIRVE